MAEITLVIAFIAGLVSFLSPCVLPLIPAYLTFLAGSTLKESEKSRFRIFLSSVFFVLGFSVVFSILGVLLQSVLAGIAYDVTKYLSYIGGTIIIFFGLLMIGIIKVPALEKEYKIKIKPEKVSYFSSFIFGAAFAIGWTPCVGAVLGSVLALSISNPQAAFPLMLSYSLGLGIPFMLVGLFISKSDKVISWLSPKLKLFNLVFGIIVVILGILVFTNSLSLIANLDFLNDILLGG